VGLFAGGSENCWALAGEIADTRTISANAQTVPNPVVSASLPRRIG
jgi:hypothetical protein